MHISIPAFIIWTLCVFIFSYFFGSNNPWSKEKKIIADDINKLTKKL